MFGTIARPLHPKGYGFITPDDGEEDIFFHVKNLVGSGGTDPELAQGMRVSYELQKGPKGRGPQAVEVQLLTPDLADVCVAQIEAEVSAADWQDTIRGIVRKHMDAMTTELLEEIGSW